MSKLAKLLLATTAFAPVFLIYAVVSAADSDYCQTAVFLSACGVLVLLCRSLLTWAKNRLQPRSYLTVSVEMADNEVFSLLLVYALPLITRDLSSYNWDSWVLVAFLFCLVVATSYGYHFNPLLVFLGYHFYKVREADGIPHILIAQRRIYRTGEELDVVRLTEYVLVERRAGG